MAEILFIPLDDPAPDGGFSAGGLDGASGITDDDAREALTAARETRAGHALALAGDWEGAAPALAASAARRTALAARGLAGPTVAARGWSDVAVLAAARDDAVGAADALARARAFAAGTAPADVAAALDDVATWLGALGGAAASGVVEAPVARQVEVLEPEPWVFDVGEDEVSFGRVLPDDDFAPAPHALVADLAADFATALVVEPLVPDPVPPAAHAGLALATYTPAAALPAVAAVVDPVAAVGADAPNAVALDADAFADDAADLIFLSVDEAPAAPEPAAPEPAAGAPAPAASAAAGLKWLDLEGPLRPWERDDAGAGASPLAQPACAVPARPAPLAPPIAPALRNSKIDEAVALATAAPEARPGRLRTLLQRFKRA